MIYLQRQQSTACIKNISASVIALTMVLNISGCGGKEQANQPQAVPVELKTIESATVTDSSEYVGTLEAQDRVSLAPRIEGRIIEIFARQGDRVTQGQPIVKLEPTQEQANVNAATQSVNVERARLGQNQAELRTAEANRAAAAAEVEAARADLQDLEAEVELAKTNIQRTKMLVDGGTSPQQDLDDNNQQLKSAIAQRNSRQESLNASLKSLQAAEKQVEQAGATIESQQATIRRVEAELASTSQNLAFNTINAPISGVVGSFDDKKVGDFVSIGEEVTTITNNQNLDLNINIPIEYRDRLQTGLLVESINQDGSSGVQGKITYIAPLVQQSTQSILTKVVFANQGNLKDREYVRVRVIWDEKPGILVPTTAISTLGGQNFVYLAQEQESQSATTAEGNNSSQTNSAPASGAQPPASGLVARQQPIKLGNIQAQEYQVVSGLKEGDRIAVSNILSLRDGTAITPAEEQQAASESSGETRQAESRQ